MRRAVLLLVLLVVPGTLLAQTPDDDWRNRQAPRDAPPPEAPPPQHGHWVRRDNYFSITPFVGYRYGGTIYADQTDVFNRDLDLESGANYGVNFDIPIGDLGFKLQLIVDHQSTELTTDTGLFEPGVNVADIDVTYYQVGALIPFAVSPRITPFLTFSGGIANLDLGLQNTSSDNRFSAALGIGAKFPINRNVAFRLEAKGFFTYIDDGNNGGCHSCGYYNGYYNHDLYQGETNFGISFNF